MNMTPQTPPPVRRGPKTSRLPVTPQKNGLMTPQASCKKLADPFTSRTSLEESGANHEDTVFKTPSSILKKPVVNLKSTNASATTNSTSKSSLLTPEFTPQRSPNRSARKRKILPDDIFKHATNTISKVNDRLSFGLLLPMPSTVGSGRKTQSSKGTRLLSPANEAKDTFVHDDIALEEVDEVVDDEIAREDEIKDEVKKELQPSLKEPITPAKQLIDDELVSHWHGKSFHNYSSDEEDDLFLSDDESLAQMKKAQPKIVNPFITSATPSVKTRKDTNPFRDPFSLPTSGDKVNYRTHMEYINNRSGDKRLVKLTASQSKILPKKLDFSNV